MQYPWQHPSNINPPILRVHAINCSQNNAEVPDIPMLNSDPGSIYPIALEHPTIGNEEKFLLHYIGGNLLGGDEAVSSCIALSIAVICWNIREENYENSNGYLDSEISTSYPMTRHVYVEVKMPWTIEDVA
jgi:hypothetical protein